MLNLPPASYAPEVVQVITIVIDFAALKNKLLRFIFLRFVCGDNRHVQVQVYKIVQKILMKFWSLQLVAGKKTRSWRFLCFRRRSTHDQCAGDECRCTEIIWGVVFFYSL